MRRTPTSLIEKYGFLDTDRRSPYHDEIQIWLYNNLDLVLQSLSSSRATKFNVEFKGLEYPLLRSRTDDSIVGFIDLHAYGHYKLDGVTNPFIVSFEVKSHIPSVGDLIRQINFYRKHEVFKSTWVVVSPDSRFIELLLTQGVYFFNFQSPNRESYGQLSLPWCRE